MITKIPNDWVQDNSQFIILDAILTYLHDQNEPVEFFSVSSGILPILKERIPIEENIVKGALRKLFKDEFLETSEKESAFQDWGIVKYYQISFEGVFFLRSGGYDGQADRIRAAKNASDAIAIEQQRQALLLLDMNILMGLGAAIGALYVILEIVKYAVEFFQNPINCWRCF
ncbi:hypothetical protein [Flavobacterium sp.]|uniref:hypothetical protein n=1 Tax=Flavobacterium sp. TaxID=239 RepID=UPI0039E3CE38